jgi:antitoxin component YwqK of YwqJK toxin-antitoxin module
MSKIILLFFLLFFASVKAKSGNFTEIKPEKDILYYKNGKLKYKGDLNGEKPEGNGIFYNENGNVKYEGEFVNGIATENGKLYFENGKLVE